MEEISTEKEAAEKLTVLRDLARGGQVQLLSATLIFVTSQSYVLSRGTTFLSSKRKPASYDYRITDFGTAPSL